jgi:hypothetical protein
MTSRFLNHTTLSSAVLVKLGVSPALTITAPGGRAGGTARTLQP